jgi:hypothetical protein
MVEDPRIQPYLVKIEGGEGSLKFSKGSLKPCVCCVLCGLCTVGERERESGGLGWGVGGWGVCTVGNVVCCLSVCIVWGC